MAEADLLKLATKEWDERRELEKQQGIFERIMAYTSQNYNEDTNKFQPPINAYVGDKTQGLDYSYIPLQVTSLNCHMVLVYYRTWNWVQIVILLA